ncbi:hypothetical protein Btru_024637 [Bulinus truncatus]|nr:hypothetical protein Btru_024637 [Bulinus truncatus]
MSKSASCDFGLLAGVDHLELEITLDLQNESNGQKFDLEAKNTDDKMTLSGILAGCQHTYIRSLEYLLDVIAYIRSLGYLPDVIAYLRSLGYLPDVIAYIRSLGYLPDVIAYIRSLGYLLDVIAYIRIICS